MISHRSLFTTIDHLIQRIDKVNVFQEHWRLVATRLAILQHELTQRHTLEDIKHLQIDIEQTLIALDKVVAGCTENEVDLDGVTYRELQSVLLRLQIRLAQHHADLIDDYQTKVKILSNAYHEQQILVQKVFDETMKQRLETIEQDTRENTIEQLRLLREKHFDTIKLYLQGCIELHKSVPLTGLTADTVAKAAQTFYQISSGEQSQLEHQWQSCDLPLTRTFIQFKPDKSTSFERNESRRLLIESDSNILQGPHRRKEASKGIWERLVSAPYMMSMIERDRYEQEEDVTEENIIQTKRWIVILGDPGSGKTSFARWLVRHLAQTLLLNGQHSTDYGPLRIPILIRIGEFAEMLKEQPSLTLFDYIGKHKWMGKTIVDNPSISLGDLSCALQDYIKHGQALIVLDGLDEIPVSDQRSLIINVVENFVDTYVQTPTGVSAFDNAYLSRLLDDPSRSGGNQLIVTSRIVGYHAAPLAGQFAHYTIRPMDMEHMKDFVDYWFFRVHQQILDTLDLSVPNQGENHGEALKKELEKTENSGLLDVASNSCLMSFVCSVAFSQMEGSPLPTQRIRLYEAIVNSMLTLWSSKRSTIPTADLIRILSDIATYIHGNSASGLIHEEKMKEICIQSIEDCSNLQNEKKIEEIEHQACEFVRIIREDVGILAARGESLYGFLHLTFQEYFTCLKLINADKMIEEKTTTDESCVKKKLQLVAQSLRRHTNDPRFRVPIALALGKISLSWSRTDFNYFCLEFIREQDESSCLLPLGAYILISYGNDLVNYPSHDVLFDALDRLMIAAGEHKWSLLCPFLFDQITNALKKLRHDMVSLWIHNLLSRYPANDIQTISALCHLLEGKPHEFENIKWLNQSSCLMLQDLSLLDNENNAFAIDRLLVKITFTNHRLLPANPNTLKEFLITHEIELNSIPAVLFPLIITLYGGLKRDGQTVVFDPFYIYRESIAITPILVRFLSRNNPERQDELIMLIKQECLRLLLTRIQNHDESPETVDLCIATICLYGIDYIRENIKLISNSLLRISFGRLKCISMILRQLYFVGDRDDALETKATKLVSNVIEKYQYNDSSKVQFLVLLNSIRSSSARLRSSTTSIFLNGVSSPEERVTLSLPNCLRKEKNFLNDILSADVEFGSDRKACSVLHHFTELFWILEHNDEYDTQYRMAVAMDRIPGYLLFRNDEDLLFPLTFVPSHLQNLYLRLMKQQFIMINVNDCPNDDGQHLYFSYILVECLMLLSNTSCKRLSMLAALVTLLPCLRMHQLENFGSSLLWIVATHQSDYLSTFETTRQRPMNYETGLYINKVENFTLEYNRANEERRTLIKNCIEQEQERLETALSDNDGRNMKLYSACVSLARVCRWTEDEKRLFLLEQSVQGAMSITNKVARLDALCVIGFYSHSDYNQIQVNENRSLQEEIEYQLHGIYPDLPLLLHTTIFIRCLSLLQDQQMINKCLQNLFSKFANAEVEDQQVVYEALSPCLQSNAVIPSILELISNNMPIRNRSMHNRSSIFLEYLDVKIDEHLSSSLFISNMYLVELVSDFHKCLTADFHYLTISHDNSHVIDELIITSLFELESSILTTAQASMITSILFSVSSPNPSKNSENLSVLLNNALHHFDLVEFKAFRLLESWLKRKDSNKLFSFAYHAALLLANSDFWSVETATIICDLLCCENDRFRQRAEIILRPKGDDNDFRTSSKLGLNILLTLNAKKTHFQYTSPFATLTLYRMLDYVTIDNQSHLDSVLWLERYRIHVLIDKKYSLDKFKSSISHVVSYFPTDVTMNVLFCDNMSRISEDLIRHMCDLITSHFVSFLEIDGDATSNTVMESHARFVVSVLVDWVALVVYNGETRQLTINALNILIEKSSNDEIRRAAVYALGYLCDRNTYKILFNKLQGEMNEEAIETDDDSTFFLSSLISSYCHCMSIYGIRFDEDDLNIFRKLLKHPSQNVLKAAYVGLGRVLKNSSLLLEMLDSDYIQCYHALMGSTAYVFIYDVQQTNQNATADFIEQHPDLLPIFVIELYNRIRHFTNSVHHVQTTDFYLDYAHPLYVAVAALIAVRIPATFCTYIKDWHDGDDFKRALYYTSKQHRRLERAACLTILSIFGELTVELCEMLIDGLRDDPHIQSTCYKCLNRIIFIKDETKVMNLLFSYLKSKSMNARYVTAKMLLHLSQSSLIPLNQVQTVLNEVILDPSSNEDLWLIKEQDKIVMECVYYHAGPLKDVIYSLLVQHLIGDISGPIQRNELNDIDLNFVESEKASRLASCLYETKAEENLPLKESSNKIKSVD